MKCKEVKYYLNDYIDGFLPDEMRFEIETHFKICKVCKAEYEDLKSIVSEAESIPKEIKPGKDLFGGIQKKIESGKIEKKKAQILNIKDKLFIRGNYKLQFKRKENQKGRQLVYALSFAVVIMGLFLAILYFNRSSTAFWSVEKLSGSPVIGSDIIDKYGMLKVGEWLETDGNSKARLKVGQIGEVDIEPGSRVKLVETKSTEYRMSLEKGKINAAIWAPPKLFFVETPSATAVDLGCMYTLEVNEDGTSYLHVTSGWVAFEYKDREAIIPQGAVCETRVNKGPGTPYFNDASKVFKTILSKIDFKNHSEKDIQALLKESREKDVLSLWHLLQTTNREERILIFDKMSLLADVSESIKREAIIAGDKKMLNLWWEELGFGSRDLF